MSRKVGTEARADKADAGKARLEFRELRAIPDNHLGSRQVQGQEGFEVLFDRNAADIEAHRARQVEEGLGARPEQVRVHTARPHAQI